MSIRVPSRLALTLCALTFAAACGGEPASDAAMDEAPSPDAAADASYPGAVAADPDHYQAFYENEVVRVLEVTYPAGESSVMHRHPAHCWIFLTDGSWVMTAEDGSTEESSSEAGGFGCEEAGSAHMPTSTAEDDIRLVLFELHSEGAAGADTFEFADAVEVDPDHYTVEFENDAVRILRIAYGPGEVGNQHGHPANCIVWLDVDESEEDGPAVGDIVCEEAYDHQPGEIDEPRDNSIELMLIEFKGRAAVE